MRLRTIQFHSHPVLGDLRLDFTDVATGRAFDTVVLAGENGTGKTAILQAIYSAMSGNRADAPTIELELSVGDIRRLRTYYGAERLQPKRGLAVITAPLQTHRRFLLSSKSNLKTEKLSVGRSTPAGP